MTATATAAMRTPPHSTEAERGLISCCLQNPTEVIPQCVDQLPGQEAFMELQLQLVYTAMVDMLDQGTTPDLINLSQRLRGKVELSWLSELVDAAPSAYNAPSYISILRDCWTRRRLIEAAGQIQALAADDHGPAADAVLDAAEVEVMSIGDRITGISGSSAGDNVDKAIQFFEQCLENRGKLIGLPSGLERLDRITHGFRNGDMIVIAARPSVGKTSLAMNIAEHIAVDERIPVGVLSLEMTAEQLVQRMICSRSRVSYSLALSGLLSQPDFPRMTTACAAIKAAPLYIDDQPAMTIGQIRAKARRLHKRFNIRCLIVDYLQIMGVQQTKGRNRQRHEEIGEMSAGLKALAKELQIPVLVLSQLNRELDKERNRRPRLSDLRESGAIEQDADLVLMLYRQGDQDEWQMADLKPVGLSIAKHRNGATTDLDLLFKPEHTRFTVASPVADVVV